AHQGLVLWPTNACTRFQASAQASAISVNLRSKELCGAPGYTFMSCFTFAFLSAVSNSSTADCGIPSSAPPKIDSTGQVYLLTASMGFGRSGQRLSPSGQP